MKIKKQVGIIFLTIVVLVSTIFCGGVIVNNYSAKKSNDNFAMNMAKVYQKYDKNITPQNKKSKYCLKRIIVSDYNGKNYGATEVVKDNNTSMAVLQFDTQDQTKVAYNKMLIDGCTVDLDGFAQLDSTDKGKICPWGSETVETPQYLDNFNMNHNDVTVAVIDTGVMLKHEALNGRFYSNGYDMSSDGYKNADLNNYFDGDYYFHSTFICGIIADNTDDNVKILPYKVVANGENTATTSSIIASINDAVEKGVSVINISISGYEGYSSYKTAIKNAVNNGVCVCVSAGNKSQEIKYIYPACTPGAITVSSMDSDGNLSSFSNFGDSVDYCAPGSKIKSSIPSTTGNSYATGSGTSFSTPYITAVCANIKSINTSITKDEVCGVITDFAKDYGDTGKDQSFGYGVPKLGNMVYDDKDNYSYSIPQGILNIYSSKDYTKSTQPWSLFSKDIIKVNIDDSVNAIGDYCFYDMEKAKFTMKDTYNTVGTYSFYGCKQLSNFRFTKDVVSIGNNAFANENDDFKIVGYSNTVAQTYASNENIDFESLGCNHNYVMEIVEPTDTSDGYTIYTCTACGDSYIGEYIKPVVIDEGQCGDNLQYHLYDTGKLLIDGTGDMFDYSTQKSPFIEYNNLIKSVVIDKNVGSINPFAFYLCNNIVEFKTSNDSYSVLDGNLYSSDKTKLICYAGGKTSNVYDMPNSVKTFDSSAFINANKLTTYNVNNNFNVDNNIVYNFSNQLVMALPTYKQKSVAFDNKIEIMPYAFLLNNSVENYYFNNQDIKLDDFSVGYKFDGVITTNNCAFYGYNHTDIQQYCSDNNFLFNSFNSGTCGENLTWQYDLDTKTLYINGSGDMDYYSSLNLVPWQNYLAQIESLIIDDDVEYLSDYAFYNATKLTSVVMPLSVGAPANITVWNNCTNINSIKLTLGSGYMADYGYDKDQSFLYTFTPWYLSRKSITSFSLDKNVISIGDYAFRNCVAINNIVLANCKNIGNYAFLACSNLKKFTNISKDTTIGDYAIFSYAVNNKYYFYSSYNIYGYDDSTAKDYAKENNISFNSLGCDHSRGTIQVSNLPSCCYDGDVKYYCKDCNKYLYTKYVHNEHKGHYVKGTIKNKQGNPIKNASVYIDNKLVSVTNNSGSFIANSILCGNHSFKVNHNLSTICVGNIIVEQSNTCGDISIYYGDFNNDGYVNAKDFAIGFKGNYADLNLLDFGKADNKEVEINSKYDIQIDPYIKSMTNDLCVENDIQRQFEAEIYLGNDYQIIQTGFIYGKNMDNDMLTIDNVGKSNSQGFIVKQALTDKSSLRQKLYYGSNSKTGKLSARYFIIYSNGVNQQTVYSDVSEYVY